MYKTIYDIEIEFNIYFTSIFKCEKYEKIFVYLFNQPEIYNLILLLLEPDGITYQIYGLWYLLVKNNKIIAKEYFQKAISMGIFNAYLSLANIAESKEKLHNLLIAYSYNIESSTGNLGIYYMSKNSNELALKYLSEAVENGEPIAMYNLGIFYLEQGDDFNAIKYFIMAGKNGYKMAYLNLMLYYANTDNIKLFAKYSFYVNIYIPTHMFKVFNQIEIKNDFVIKRITEYENFISQMYLSNTNILIGDLIGDNKMEELSNIAAENIPINEIIIVGDKQINFKYIYNI
jgi:TPR repeat protein